MALGIVEIFALIVAIAIAIKLIVILVKPASWMKIVKPIYANKKLTMIVSLVLAAVVLYYLNQAGITIVQIFAVMLFIALLAGISLSAYSEELMGVAETLLQDKAAIKKAWLSIIVWIALTIWALYVLLI